MNQNKTNQKYLEKKQLGHWGETKAKEYLIKELIIIVAENYRSSHGEVDLIGWDGGCLVFFEVKTRQSLNYGAPEQAVEKNKLSHIINVAFDYMSCKFNEEPLWRIDIISVLKNPKTEAFQIDWIKNAQY